MPLIGAAIDATRDTAGLVAFRSATLRGRGRVWARGGLLLIALLTIGAAVLPALVPAGDERRLEVLSVLPGALVLLFALAALSAAAAGGGRELIGREEAVAFPVSPATDHLGALLMAPLNIAWMLQSWVLLGSVAFVIGPRWWLVTSQALMVLWLLAATSLAQVIGWEVEWLRRGPRGVLVTRTLSALAAGGMGLLVAEGKVVAFLDRSPTVPLVIALLRPPDHRYVVTAVVLVAVAALAVVLGAVVARAVTARPARDVALAETTVYPPRAMAGSDLAAMIRADRVSIWRSVPLRRGLIVLAVMPGLVALAGDLQWDLLAVLPGLVAAGGALLFGVNSWCLDGRGALWRDSLPTDYRVAFAARAIVLAEVLAVASGVTIAVSSLRAGPPGAAEAAAVLSAATVVVLQVVSASLRWSVERPFSVDLRSARATPAPALVMVGYSARLALSTTLVGMVFSALSQAPWGWSPAVALPLVLFAMWRLVRTASVWADPATRSRVVCTVAA